MEEQRISPDMATQFPIPPTNSPYAESVKQQNPLSTYYRQPKIYVNLPSKGKFYPAGSLDISETGDYAVYAMTAKDELMFKTPDALMSGQSTVEVIKSCIPAIKDPWKMPSIDIDAVLIAIRIATYGDTMEITAECPKCKESNDYDLQLVSHLERLHNFEYQREIVIDPLIIIIKPYNYKEVTQSTIKAAEQEKIFDVINNNDLSDEEKLAQFGDSFIKLTGMTIDLIANAIEKIITPEDEVTDRKFINEFISNSPKEVFDKIKNHIDGISEQLEFKSKNVKCAECGFEFSTVITMDKSNFFDVRF